MTSVATFRDLGRWGELGNQLFQVAAVSGYAWKNRKLPIFPEWRCSISGRDYTKIFKNHPVQTPLQNLRPPFFFSENFQYMGLKYMDLPRVEGNVNFTGYFQSEKYFEGFENRIREMFTPSDEISDYVSSKYRHLKTFSNRVSLQIRTNKRVGPDAPSQHAAADHDFILESMKHFHEDSLYVVFADVMEEAKKILPVGKKYIFIENEENYVDLFLMRDFFENYIVSPSTFAWWGAWLSTSPSPKIVVKRDWFVKGSPLEHLLDNDILPDRWIKI
jgi:hypothetical protein